MISQQTVVVGIGSHHGDDQAGWRVATHVQQACDRDKVGVHHARSPIQILDWIDDAERLIICDACRGIGEAGQLRRFDWPDHQLCLPNWSGTHDFSLIATLQLAEQLGRLPKQVVIWAIEATTDPTPADLSAAVAAGVLKLAERLVSELDEPTDSREQACTNIR